MKRLFSLMFVMLAIIMPMKLWAQEPYAVLTTDSATILSQDSTGVTYGKTLTFYYDNQRTARNGMSVGPFFGYPDDYPAWHSSAGSITKAVFDVSFANCSSITSTAYWFYQCSKLSQIEGIENLKTDSVTDMGVMFSGCSSLTSLDVSQFNTGNVTDMGFMFYDCSGLTSLDVSNFNTSNVTNMQYIFGECSGLTSLDVSHFNTENVTYLDGMFYDCSGLTSLDVSGFKTDNVTGMSWLFSGCTGLTNLDVSGFKTDNVMNMFNMFSDCSGLRNLDVSNFNTENVTDISGMFSGCSGLTNLDVSNFKTDNVTNMSNMFRGCSSLTTIYAGSGWSTAAVTNSSSMFSNCTNLVGGARTIYDENHIDATYAHIDGGTSNPGYFTDKNASAVAEPYAVISNGNTMLTFYYDDKKTERDGLSVGPFSNMLEKGWGDYMNMVIMNVVFDASFANCTTLTSTADWFSGCSYLTTITGIEYLNTDNVTNMNRMFYGCSHLTTLDISNFNTSNVTDMAEMFGGCSGLTTLNVSNFNTSNVTNMSSMFSNCSGLTSLDVSNFNTSNVTNMNSMFDNCSGLTSLDIRNFNTPNVTEMGAMFYGCSGLISLDLSNLNTDSVTVMKWMFTGCSGLTTIDLSQFNTSKVTEMSRMFEGCSSLTSLELNNFNTSTAIHMDKMFMGCSSLASLDLSHFETPLLIDVNSMFRDAAALTTIYVGDSWDMTYVSNGADMFTGCTNLVGGAGTTYNENHVDHSYAHIDGGASNPGYFTDKNAPIYNDGDVFTAETIEGVTVTYQIISVEGMTCKVGKNDSEVAIDANTTGPVTIPEEVNGFKVITIGGYAFKGCAGVTQFNLPETIETIIYGAFRNCTGLTSFTFPNSVITLYGNHILNGCTGLTSIHIPANIRSMGNNTMANCPNIVEVTVDPNSNYFESPEGSYAIINKNKKSLVQGFKNTVIPEYVTYIESAAFVGNEYRNIVIPKNVEGFYWDAFQYNDVESITVAEGNAVYDSRNNCNAMMETATNKLVKGCKNTVIPSDTKIIGESAFAYSDFSNDYPSIENVELPEGVVTIENWAFSCCKDLKSVTIPSTVTSIGNNSFLFNNNLKTIISHISEPFALEGYIFENKTLQEATLYVPVGTKALYQATEGWNKFANIVEMDSTVKAEPYAVLTTDSATILSQDSTGVTYGKTLTFYYDDQKATRGGMSVGPFTYKAERGWSSYVQDITTVVFDDTFTNCTTLTSTAFWFYGCEKLTDISGIGNLKTDNVTNMCGMFYGCSGLTNLDVSNFKTDNVTNMGSMFYNCSGLTSLDVSNFNTDNVTDMYGMFSRCSSLTSLDLSNFRTDKVTSMNHMFYDCSGLTSLNVSSFKTDNVTDMNNMFLRCSGLTDLDLSGFNTANVTNMNYMFYDCSGLTSLDVSSFNTANVTYMSYMFYGCSGLTNLDVSNFKTDNVTHMSWMFYGCSGLTSLDVSNFKTDNVTYMNNLFSFCSELNTIYAGRGWSTEAVTEGGDMFTGCTKLVGGAGTPYDSNHVDYTYAHIDGGTSNPGYFTDIESVRRWDFTKWSSETIANLKADAAASKTTGWSDVEKKADAEAGAEPTEAAKDNCFWLDAETTEANGVAIAELEGLVFNKSYCSSRKLAIAVNYPSTSLGDYAGGAYLWLGGMDSDCFTIPNVKNGQTITIELESHKTSDGRGITLIAGSTELDSFTTMTKASYSWTIPEDCDVVVRNTNGCHIYTITVSGEGTPTDTLEIYAVETGSTITPNQPIMATQSVVVTPGNDVEWLTNMSMGSAWVNPLDFTSNIYYPGSTTTYTFEGSMRGTNNPKDGDLEDGVSTGSGYKPYLKNFPKSGGFLTFEVQQEGSLIVPIRVFAGKPLYVTDKTGTAKKDIQFKDASGQTLALQTNPLCAVSADEDVTGFVSFNVQPGEKYYVFSVGSKARFGGYVFSKQAIDIDPATMANVIDSLDALPITLEPYAVLTTDTTSVLSSDSTGVTYGKTLTFYYDGQKAERNGMSVGPFTNSESVTWYNQRESITTAKFDPSFANYTTLTSTANWFFECKNMTAISGIEYLKTDSVTTMGSMFESCSGLTTLDVSYFNTANVTEMWAMFKGCSSLTTLDLSHFNTQNVTSMAGMFNSCSSLTSLDVSGFKTDNVTIMNFMFEGCSGLTTLDVSHFNTENVTYISGMFFGCSSLTSLDVSNFKTDNVMDMSGMFSSCSGLTSLDVSHFNTQNVTSMSGMFSSCSGLTSLDVSNFKTDNVTDMSSMFSGCTGLTNLDVSNFNTSKVTSMFTMFYGCSGLTSLDLSSFNTGNVTSMQSMFLGCTGLTSLDLSNFNTENVTNMSWMFSKCSSLTSLDLSSFNTSNVKYEFDTNNYINYSFGIQSMFEGCSALTTIWVGDNWTTANLTESVDVFKDCAVLVGGAGTHFDPNHVDYTYAHIDGGTSNPGYFTDKNAPVIEATFDGRVLAVGGSTTMTDALESVGGRDEVAKTITAIVWNSSAALTNSDLQGLDNPNMLIYVNERSLAPQDRNNVVVNGLAMNVVLSDTGSGNCDFYAPQTFTAEMITYSREFKQATQVGVCRGWETISLPFMVQTIAHADQGVITPFGIDTSNKHFWLRQLSTNGLVSATKIEANLPYLISMPNDEKNYAKEYILKGLVTFSAENAVVPKTEPTALALADSSVVMMPALQSVGKSSTVWALNVGMERSQYFEGSTFERDYREVRPFEAYTVHRSDSPAPRFLPINDLMNSATGIETISNVIMTHDNYYHIDGRKVDGKPTKKGLYITNGRKIVIK